MNQTDIKQEENNTSFNPENKEPQSFPEVDTKKTEEVEEKQINEIITENAQNPKSELEKPLRVDDLDQLAIPMTDEEKSEEVQEPEEDKGNFEGKSLNWP